MRARSRRVSRTVAVVSHRYWPLFDLRLTTPDLELRVATEVDQLRLADVLPVDVEIDARLPTYDLGDARASRGAATFQGYWRAFGSWRPESWAVPFVVIQCIAVGLVIAFPALVMHYKGTGPLIDPSKIQIEIPQLDFPPPPLDFGPPSKPQ